MRVKSHQLPMTMRRATDPRMESLPVDWKGGWRRWRSDIQEEDVRGGTAHRRKPTAVWFHLNSKARVAKASALSSGVSVREMLSLYWLIFRMKSKHFRLLLAKV